MNKALHFLLPVLAVMAIPVLTPADTCTVPPMGSLTLAQSKDSFWRAKWCSNDSMIGILWSGLGLKDSGDLWEGWGYEDVCNDWKFLPRLMNAGFIVREVQKIATHFGENHEGTIWLPTHEWWNFVKAREDDGYEPKCCNTEPNKNATHYCCATSTDVCVKWGYKVAAPLRSGTLVHEATHEDVGHIDEDECTPSSTSCDTFYGDYNAQTMQINYLYDAISAYKIETVNNVVQRKVAQFTDGSTQMCKYVPLFEDDDRASMLSSIQDKLDSKFAYGAVFANYADVGTIDAVYGTPWACKGCNLSDYTFSPGINNKACNEVINPANAGVNASMRNACTDFSQAISTAPGAEAYASLYASFYSKSTNKCLPYDQAALDAYCENQQNSAGTVGDLDPYGWLSSNGYNEEFNCAADFCQEKFQESWTAHAGDPKWDDPRGCLDLLCGNDAKCRRRFLTYGGDPDYYQPSHCFDVLLTCYEDQSAVYTPGGRKSPQLTKCDDQYKLCETMEAAKRRFLGLVLMRKWEIPGSGPVERFKGTPWVNPLAQAFQTKMVRLNAEGLSEQQQDLEMRRVLAQPESIAALYRFDPAGFVALFGKSRYRAIVGPSIANVTPRVFRMKELNARSKVVFEGIRKMDPSVPAIRQ